MLRLRATLTKPKSPNTLRKPVTLPHENLSQVLIIWSVKTLDGKKGFGGKFGVQSERKDVSAHGWEGGDSKPAAPPKPKVESGVSISNMKSMFEKPKVAFGASLNNLIEQYLLLVLTG